MITFKKECHVGILMIDRPEALNALNLDTLAELKHYATTLAEDDDLRCLIISGVGKAFVAGADIAQMKDLTPDEAAEFSRRGHEAFVALESLPFPVISAINGYALGGGCELALSTDIRIASTRAKFAQPEVGLGITPGFGGTQRLTRTVGMAKAMELILTGSTIDAAEALRIGLISYVVEPEQLMETAMTLANKIANNAPVAVRASKRAIRRCFDNQLPSDLEAESVLFGTCFATHDQKMAMEAFVSKQPKAEFTGK